MNKSAHLAILLIVFGASSVLAKAPNARIRIAIDDADGLVSVGDSVTFSANIKNETDRPLSGKIQWLVHTVAFEAPPSDASPITIAPADTAQQDFPLTLPTAGFADIECRLIIDDRSPLIAGHSRVGAAPEKITSALTQEDDFTEFWQRSLAELEKVPTEFQLTAKPEQAKEGVDLFEVSMRSYGKVRVRGWLEIPRNPGPQAVVIRVPGYGGNMKPIGRQDMIVFSFNPRGHGNSQQDISGQPRNYWVRGLDNKDTYFYRGAYLDCVRAVDFICSRPEVDPKRIAVWGASQGGGFAFATAALDSRVALCIADIPFLCDWHNYFELTRWPEMIEWIQEKEHRNWKKTLRTMSYFDTLNLCSRVRCKTYMGVGLQDQVCPPTTSFAAFNRIPGNKTHRIYSNRGHGMDDEHWLWVWSQIRSEFQLPENE